MRKILGAVLLILSSTTAIQAALLPTPKPEDKFIVSTFTQAMTEAREATKSLPLIMAMDPTCVRDFYRSTSAQEQIRKLMEYSGDEKAKSQILNILNANRIWMREPAPGGYLRTKAKTQDSIDSVRQTNLETQIKLIKQINSLNIKLKTAAYPSRRDDERLKGNLVKQLEQLQNQYGRTKTGKPAKDQYDELNGQLKTLIQDAEKGTVSYILQNNLVRQFEKIVRV
ncbi:hypothetical protein HY994_03980 [Candidatus Micrarchaeota archaeon]|nr:hypothetical protein [Candidatus Micrarchaeota archaeon]